MQNQMQSYDEVDERHLSWLEARYTEFPPIRLAILQEEDEQPVYVDAVFLAAAMGCRGVYAPPVKRGRGRPRKVAK